MGFSIRTGEMDGLPIIAMINEEITPEHKALHQFFLSVETLLVSPEENGMPNDEEAAELNAFEDQLGALLSQFGSHVFIGRVTHKGRREQLYYIDSPEQVVQTLKQIVDSNSTRKFGFVCKPDIAWENVSVWLKPKESLLDRLFGKS